MIIKPGLSSIWGFFKIITQGFFISIQQLYLGIGLEISTVCQKLQTTPSRLNSLKDFMMQNFIQLGTDGFINFSNIKIKERFIDLVNLLSCFKRQIKKYLQTSSNALVCICFSHFTRIMKILDIHWINQWFQISE